jgi:hypothetical protein
VRVLLLVAMVLGLSGAVPALADPGAPAPVDACVVTDKRITELSGLASDGTHWYAHNDGGTKIVVFVLNKKCAVEKTITAPLDPYDVEDLARAPDGTLWLSDTGDNDSKRATVAVTELTLDGRTTLHRLTFPDGAHDTEALLLDRRGVPYLITKNPLGIAGIYRPTGPLASPGPTPLEKVGELHLSSTGTQGGPVPSIVGSVLVTGAASNADGSVVAVRTYTDAYLFAVPPSGDLVAALGGTPVRVPLPNEKQGEAIAFEPDGTLLSGTEGVGQPIRMVPGAAALVASAPPPAGNTPRGQPGEASQPAPAAAQTHRDGLPTMPAIGVTVGVIVLILLYLRRRKAR